MLFKECTLKQLDETFGLKPLMLLADRSICGYA